MNYKFQKLTREIYDRILNKFHSGNLNIDEFINSTKCLDVSYGRTYVSLDNKNTIIAYYNITTGSITDPTYLDLKIGGSIHINKFALGVKWQGSHLIVNDMDMKLSDYLFMLCIEQIRKLRDEVGFTFITLCSTNEGLHLYQRAGFVLPDEDMKVVQDESEKGCYQMYYPLDIEE